MNVGTVETLSALLSQALHELADLLFREDGVRGFLSRLGWDLPPGVEDVGFVVTDFQRVTNALNTVAASTEAEREDEALMARRFGDLVAALVALATHLDQVMRGLSALPAMTQAYLDKTHIGEQLVTRLIDYIVIRMVERHQYPTARAMVLLGLFEVQTREAVTANFQPAYMAHVVHWSRIGTLVSDPGRLMTEAYGWNTAQFDSSSFLRNVALLLDSVGASVQAAPLPRLVEERLVGRSVPQADTDPMPQVRMNLLGDRVPGVEAGFTLAALRESATGATDAGVGLFPFLRGDPELLFPLPGTQRWQVEIDVGLDVEGGLLLAMRPGQPPQLQSGLADGGAGGATVAGRLAAGLRLATMPDKPARPLSFGAGSGLEVGGFRLIFEVAFDGQGVQPGFLVELKPAALLLAPGNGDGFLAKVLPPDGLRAEFDVAIGWSAQRGVYFEGGAGLEATLPANIDLFGVVKIKAFHVGLQAGGSGLGAALSTTLGIRLGPVSATIEKIGLTTGFAFRGNGGNLGFADATLGFKPPSGVGLKIDAQAVKGGGFLAFDAVKQQYVGALQLSIRNTFALNVIGLLNTRMPDGRPGFSLLLIVTADFPPIQLGYGFTLNGVGGLAGINRTMKLDVLRDGIANRTLGSILFPTDPVANATQLISDLQAVFPVAPDRFVFAPMVKIAWGQSILLIEIGLAVELPSPLRLAIMGRVHLLLPPGDEGASEETPDKVVEIHMDVLGILDFDRNEISVDAVLYDSRLAIFAITGGMALRLRWGADPVFLLAVGGFNPRYAPPPGFPSLDRVGIQLSYDRDGLKAALRLESYVAVTANSLQFGARIDAYAEALGARVAGYLGFDALIEGSPFHVIVDIYGGVTVKAFMLVFSCDVLLTLTGFEPVTGDGHVTIEFFGTHEIPVRFVIGESKPPAPLPLVDPMDELVAALADVRSWSATVPPDAGMLVTLRQLTAAEEQLNAGSVLAHPLGRLSVRQKVLPFGIVLERFGAAAVSTPGPYAISGFTLGATTAAPASGSVLRDAFARGQFVTLSEDDKLTAPAFEQFDCGHDASGAGAPAFGSAQVASFDYAVSIIDNRKERPRALAAQAVPVQDLLRTVSCGAAASRIAALSSVGAYAGPSQGIRVRQPAYKVVDDESVQAQVATFHSHTEADRARRGTPGHRQVVEAHELL